jgi:hypothetical protein
VIHTAQFRIVPALGYLDYSRSRLVSKLDGLPSSELRTARLANERGHPRHTWLPGAAAFIP